MLGRLARLVALIALLTVCSPAAPGAAGTLDFDGGAPAIGDFGSITLTGASQLSSLSIAPFTVTDATDSLAGWHVLLTIPDLVNGASTIPASEITMAAPQVSAVAPATMTGVTANAVDGFTGGQKIVVATAGNGAGSYLVSPYMLKVEVPATARSGTYVSSGTISLNSGP